MIETVGSFTSWLMTVHGHSKAAIYDKLVSLTNEFGIAHFACFSEPTPSNPGQFHVHASIQFKGRRSLTAFNQRLVSEELIVHLKHLSKEDYWGHYKYLVAPKKNKVVDESPLLSCHHPPVPGKWNLDERPKRMSRVEFHQLMLEKGISSKQELLALCNTNERLQEFYFSNINTIPKLIKASIEMRNAEQTRIMRSREDYLRCAADQDCVCSGTTNAKLNEMLADNGINPDYLWSSLHRSLLVGAEKGRNVFIYGVSDSGKSTLLKPLIEIFGETVLSTPQRSSFPLESIKAKQVLVWNEFRYDWKSPVIPWDTLLQLMDGTAMQIAVSHASGDENYEYKSSLPIFITTNAIPFFKTKEGIDWDEMRQLSNRVDGIYLQKPLLSMDSQYKPCVSCYSKMILSAATNTIGINKFLSAPPSSILSLFDSDEHSDHSIALRLFFYKDCSYTMESARQDGVLEFSYYDQGKPLACNIVRDYESIKTGASVNGPTLLGCSPTWYNYDYHNAMYYNGYYSPMPFVTTPWTQLNYSTSKQPTVSVSSRLPHVQKKIYK